jgi:quinoprotein relay system zinc metallohydrolase 1
MSSPWWGLPPVIGMSALAGPAMALPPSLPERTPPAQPDAAQSPAVRPDPVRLDLGQDLALRARRLAEHTWVIEGAVDDFHPRNGCNIINTAFIATGVGVLVINTGPSRAYGLQQQRLIAQTTREPVVQVVNLNQHPDHFLGNQAWTGVGVQALPGSQQAMRQEGEALTDNLQRLCGDWQRGTQAMPASQPVPLGLQSLGQHRLEWLRLQGHTPDDLVLIDHTTGVAFVGGLVFKDRVPTTPHATPARWLESLDRLQAWHEAGYFQWVVPSHGPVHQGLSGLAQTRDWLQWAERHLRDSADAGKDLSEMLAAPLPERFAGWAAQPAEWHRTLVQWYPHFEVQALQARSSGLTPTTSR